MGISRLQAPYNDAVISTRSVVHTDFTSDLNTLRSQAAEDFVKIEAVATKGIDDHLMQYSSLEQLLHLEPHIDPWKARWDVRKHPW